MGATSFVAAVATTLVLAACSSGQERDAGEQQPAEPAGGDAGKVTEAPSTEPVATPELDSIAVIGHSGATGTVSDPANTLRDAVENSWATGDSPAVRSIYQRLLRTHPALEGHAYNAAVNGTQVTDLAAQVDDLAETVEVIPDLVIIQTIDNDQRCDGTDEQNYRPFGRALDDVIDKIDDTMPGAWVYLVSPWADVATWTNWAQHVNSHVANLSGTGPCDVFDARGRPRPAGIESQQKIVDGYWAQVEEVCHRHARCFTDDRSLEEHFVPTDEDVSIDSSHLSIAGHAKYAAIAWRALPKAIKNAP